MTLMATAGGGQPNRSVMRTPRKLDIDITARCNLRCRYCYFFSNPAVEYRDLPTEEWLRFFDELGTLGVMEVTLAGGEPFIREDLATLLEGIVRNRMRFSILSNGALIDDGWRPLSPLAADASWSRSRWMVPVQQYTIAAVVRALSRGRYAASVSCNAMG